MNSSTYIPFYFCVWEEFEDTIRGNKNPYIEEEQTKQWPKEKVQKDKQQSTKHTHKTKDRVTRTPLKTEGELRCFLSVDLYRLCIFWEKKSH